MIVNFKKFNLITEDPDTIYYNHKTYNCQDYDAKPFFVNVSDDDQDVEGIYFGESGEYHDSIEEYSETRAYPGRLWINGKIIAFWVYPNEVLFKKIIRRIEKELGIKIFNNGWMMEIIKKGDTIKRRKDYEDKYINTGEYGHATIVPIEEYAGSEDVPEEQKIFHLMNWKEKELAKKIGKMHFGRFGSVRGSWDQPHNIKWRRAIYQESKKF